MDYVNFSAIWASCLDELVKNHPIIFGSLFIFIFIPISRRKDFCNFKKPFIGIAIRLEQDIEGRLVPCERFSRLKIDIQDICDLELDFGNFGEVSPMLLGIVFDGSIVVPDRGGILLLEIIFFGDSNKD